MGTKLDAVRDATMDITNAKMIQSTIPTVTLVEVFFEIVDKKMAIP